MFQCSISSLSHARSHILFLSLWGKDKVKMRWDMGGGGGKMLVTDWALPEGNFQLCPYFNVCQPKTGQNVSSEMWIYQPLTDYLLKFTSQINSSITLFVWNRPNKFIFHQHLTGGWCQLWASGWTQQNSNMVPAGLNIMDVRPMQRD